MLSRVLRGLYHFTVYAIGITVLLAAVSVTLIRLALPDIGEYRGEVEAWVSRYMGFPVVIHSMEATWRGWIPHLHLTDIDLLNKAGTRPITHFDNAKIDINPIATLIKRQFIPKHLMVSGFKLSIARLGNGAIYIEGINIGDIQNAQPGNSELAEWLFKQEKIEIQNAQIEWIDIKHEQAPILLTNVHLMLKTDRDRIQVEGSTTLPVSYGKQMDFAFDAFGNLLSSEWSGDLYLSANDINPDNWYKNTRPLDINIAGGSADIKVWSTWKKAKLTQLDGELEYNDFATLAGDASLHVEELSYRFQGKRDSNNGWHFHLKLGNLLTENGIWPATDILITAEPTGASNDYRFITSFGYLKLDDLTPLISNLSFLPQNTKQILLNTSINGELRDGRLTFDPQKDPASQLIYDIKFDHLSTQFNNKLPSFRDLSGRLQGTLSQGVVTLQDDAAELLFPERQKNPISLSNIDGKVAWKHTKDDWQFYTELLRLNTPDFTATVSGEVKDNIRQASPYIDLIVKIDDSDLENIAKYVPRTEKFKLRDWMQRTILGGRLQSADAIFRGYLADFPFNEKQGQFKAIVNVANGVLEYSPKWPLVDNIFAEILFEGKEMSASFGGGDIFNANIVNGSAVIGDITRKQKTVNLEGHIKGGTKDLALFISQSPLQDQTALKEVGNALKSGSIDLDLKLLIPIKSKEKKFEVDGDLYFTDATLDSGLKDVDIKNLNGDVKFSRTAVSGDGLTAILYDQPVSLNIKGSRLDPKNLATVVISGITDEAFITERLMEYFPNLSIYKRQFLERVSGQTDWNVSLTYQHDEPGSELTKILEINSDLTGLNIDLPNPLGKTAYMAVPIKITRHLSQIPDPDIRLQYGSIVSCNFELNPLNHTGLRRTHLRFGDDSTLSSNKQGLQLSGMIDELQLGEWWEVIKQFTASSPKTYKASNAVDVDLQIASLWMLGQNMSDVKLAANRDTDDWHININNPKMIGNITLPSGLESKGTITFDFDKLYINKDTASSQGEPIDPRNIPALEIHVDDFEFNDKKLGEMNLLASPIENGLAVNQFNFSKPSLNIEGSGNWQIINDQDNSNFHIELHADRIDAMFDAFKYDMTTINKGETNMEIDANWIGSPIDFALEKLNGKLSMQINKGQFLDINPAAGRLFGLLSIQTLPRRLSLDFTDLFSKGLAFDKIEGNFEITNGNAYTNNLYMRGPSADVAVSGRTGLSEQDYDQIVTVTPQVTGNLPVAGALLGPVGIGLGAVLYLAGEMFESVNEGFNKLLRYQYTITGSWYNPVIEKYQTQAKEEASG